MGIETIVTNGWWERFCKHHSEITLKVAIPLSLARAMATDEDVFNRYFDMLEDCLRCNEIFDSPSRIFNCDETGLPLALKSEKVVDKVGYKNPSFVSGSSKSQFTVLTCTNVVGYAIPPFVIFKRKSLNPLFLQQAVISLQNLFPSIAGDRVVALKKHQKWFSTQ